MNRYGIPVLVATMALAACTGGSTPSATLQASSSTGASSVTVIEGDVAATAVEVGDCLSGIVIGSSERALISTARKVHCFSPHGVEVFATFVLGAGDFDGDEPTEFPGRAPIVRAADRGCTERLEQLVGPQDRPFGLLALWPTRRSWGAGDRTVACAVFDLSGRPFDAPQFS